MPPVSTTVQLSFQVCPIILVGGIAASTPGGILPVLSLFSPGGSALNLPFDITDLDDAFASFNVLAGGQLVLQTIAKYPFANQSVGANAVIREPLTISVIMDTPMRGANAWAIKRAVFTSLKGTLDAHNIGGGTYTVATPAYLYDNLVMTALTDNSRGNSSLPQNAWRFDFERPLIALQDLQDAQNALTSKITNGVPTNANQSGVQTPTTTSQTNQTRTFPGLSGGLGGGPAIPVVRPSTQTNYPAIISQGGTPFRGIS